jgi:formate hydrogenlyase transcriptional activator
LLCAHDLEGRLLSINPVPARLLGYSVDEMLRKPMQDFIDPRFRDQFDDYLREIESNGKAHGLLAVITKSGERRIWEYHNTLRTEGVPAPVVRGIAYDVTERVRAEKALRESNEQLTKAARERERAVCELTLFRALLDQSNDSIEVIDPHTLRILDVNERECLELGHTREELLSMTVYDIDMDISESARAEVQRQLEDSGFATFQRMRRRKDGTTFPVEVTLRRVRLDHAYDVATARNITKRKRAEEGLRASEERLRLALEATRIGTFERNLQTGGSRWSPEMEAIYGLAPGTFPKSIEAFVELIHVGDRPSVARLVEQSMRIGDAEGEWRVIWPDGTVHWIAGRWRVIQDEHGHPARVLGVDFDITERKRTEEALRQSEERFRVALKNAPIAVFNQDLDLRYTWISSSELPWSGNESLGKTVFDVFEPEEAARITEVRRRVLETGVGARDQVQLTCRGKKYCLDTTIEPVRDASGAVIGLTGASMDVTDLREATEALREAQKRLTEEKLYLEQEINTELGFGEIIGQSKELQAVMQQVGKVASSDSTVLLLGETGTGKELVARATHWLSLRAGNSFIKMNCAAIPSGLLESELFGHERGAFTGAVSRKIGRIELADKGTLFLDEIGEIPLALQPKLLRVLQDKEFERLGGTKTLKVDFRLIAATNRDLANRVREKEFRSDLYYRLNVFPIRVPSLRQRREDIGLLVEYFVQKFARRMNKAITSIPKATIDALTCWDWPGNVRELENFIERSVILTNGSVLVSPLSELKPVTAENNSMDQTLETAERMHILRALRESRGQIGGRHGAAARLGLKRTTLQSKLKQLGINPRSMPAA